MSLSGLREFGVLCAASSGGVTARLALWTACRSRSSRGSLSAISDPTARASPPPSRSSPLHPGARLRPLRDTGPRSLEGARRPRSQHRRRLRTADPALVGPAGHRVVRAAEGYIQGSSLRLWPHAGRGCAGDGTWSRCSTCPCGSSAWASGCGATSPPRCCTSPRSSSWTSRQ